MEERHIEYRESRYVLSRTFAFSLHVALSFGSITGPIC